jgi:hypothetical protein
LQFQAQLPTFSAFVSAPYQNGIARILICEVKKPQSLPNDKSLRYDRQATLAANVCGVPFGTHLFPRIVPLDGHRHARVDTLAPANLAHPDPATHVFHPWVVENPCVLTVAVAPSPGRAPSVPAEAAYAKNPISRAPPDDSSSPPDSFDGAVSVAGG